MMAGFFMLRTVPSLLNTSEKDLKAVLWGGLFQIFFNSLTNKLTTGSRVISCLLGCRGQFI